MPGKRAILRVQVDGNAKQELDRICEDRGMTQIAVMSRLVSWFIRQDQVIQTAVMSTLSDSALIPLAKDLLKKMSSTKGSGGPNV